MTSLNRSSSSGYVGFDKLPMQLHRRALRAGFEFTIMVVGETGLGKSTFVNSLFLRELCEGRPKKDFSAVKKTVEVNAKTHEISEKNVNLKLTVVDTPGYGDRINNETSWKPILDYIEDQYKNFLEEEKKISRKKIPDSRVHVCLYFIAPTGPAQGLKELDVEFMKRLHKKVNIIPIVAKADSMTENELKAFKDVIRGEIKHNNIEVYEFPFEEDESEELKITWPYAVVGSTTGLTESNGAFRQYSWGTCEVENEKHSDFPILRKLLIEEFLQDLKEVTHDVHYENFRTDQLADSGELGEVDDDAQDLLKEREMKFKMEMKSNEDRILAREAELRDKEEKLQKMLERYKTQQAEEGKKGADASSTSPSPSGKKKKKRDH